MVEFSWQSCVRGLGGGVIIGLSMVLFFSLYGRISGISGIVNHAFTFKRGDWMWRWFYMAGVITAGLITRYAEVPNALAPMPSGGDWATIVLSGYLVGFGTVLGNGCTSGHGLCGMARMSPRSMTNTAVFFVVGIITASVTPYAPVAATISLCVATAVTGMAVAVRRSYMDASSTLTDHPKLARGVSTSSIRPDITMWDQLTNWRESLVAFMAALVFGMGLACAQMTNPNVVLNFLRIDSDWDPTLAFVMLAGLPVCFFGFWPVLKRGAPVCGQTFHLPHERDITLPLVAGGVCFGVGWGLVGLCPGPGLFTLITGDLNYYVWFLCQLAGIYVHALVTRAAAYIGERVRARTGLAASSIALALVT